MIDGPAKIIKRTDPAYASIREQNEPITDAFGVGELMNSKGERSALRSDSAHKVHNFSRLPDVEAVKGLRASLDAGAGIAGATSGAAYGRAF